MKIKDIVIELYKKLEAEKGFLCYFDVIQVPHKYGNKIGKIVTSPHSTLMNRKYEINHLHQLLVHYNFQKVLRTEKYYNMELKG